jgi:methylated-DNA-[protein]-cysteine S-methyltransferase
MKLAARTLDSPIGALTVLASDAGVVAILFPEEVWRRADDELLVGVDDAVLDRAEAQLEEYFAGARTEFDLPLDLRGTEFQVTAWEALAEVGFGETTSYQDQARRIGRPTAVRAVGAANGRNPIPIVLPCHRIVGANGSLTGYAGGLDTKRWLLDHERRVIATDE